MSGINEYDNVEDVINFSQVRPKAQNVEQLIVSAIQYHKDNQDVPIQNSTRYLSDSHVEQFECGFGSYAQIVNEKPKVDERLIDRCVHVLKEPSIFNHFASYF
ncbi:Hypothetical_protein [Hexamita inflata]|uniref:Hypothetical_protein n=1 Tax=Hexamita inflata TaxID=28002 RepID=A0AA86PJ62_9EUKA|nr:Hypothetical protein HINF_LOCUS24247 [Hexamita inflata]